MHRIAELLCGRCIRIVFAQVGVFGFMAVSSPMPLVFPSIGVIHNYAMIAIAVGDVYFVRIFVDESFGWQPQVLHVVTASTLIWLTNLHQELAILGEFQDHIVV